MKLNEIRPLVIVEAALPWKGKVQDNNESVTRLSSSASTEQRGLKNYYLSSKSRCQFFLPVAANQTRQNV